MTEADEAFLARFNRRVRPPVASLLSSRALAFDIEAGTSVVAFEARPDFGNVMGAVQGGIVAAMLDSAMSYAAFAMTDYEKVFVTLEMKTSYLAPAPLGRLIGEGRVVRMGRSIAFLAGELKGEDGEVYAVSTATVRVRPRRVAEGGKAEAG